MATLFELLAFTLLAVIDLFIFFYGTTLAMSYPYAIDWASRRMEVATPGADPANV